jgi:hypothetical protein
VTNADHVLARRRDIGLPDMLKDEECAGAGRCHGCMCWCDVCGDVGDVCHARGCMRHWCMSCGELLHADDSYNYGSTPAPCATCLTALLNEDAQLEFERLIERNDEDSLRRANRIATVIASNPIPYLGSMGEPWWGRRT